MDVPATRETLVLSALSRLDDLIGICNQAIGASDDIDTDSSYGHNEAATGEPRLAQLYRDRDDANSMIQMHCAEQKDRPDVPAPKQNLKCSAKLAALEQGPRLTTADYEVLARGQQTKLNL